MNEIITLIEQQSPFIQGILGSAAFALILIISRVILAKTRKSGKQFVKGCSRDILFKHWVHKELVKSRDQHLFTLGHFLVFIESFRWIVRGALILLFFFGVFALIEKQWLEFLAYYFTFNCFFEASRWLKDSSTDDVIEGIDEEVKKEFFDDWYNKKNKNSEKAIEKEKQANKALNQDAT